MGAQVHVLVRRSPHHLLHLGPVQERLSFHQADVRRYDQVLEALQPLQNYEDIIIFHLAAQAHVGESWKAPEITLQTNVLGTLNLLKAARELRLELHCFDYAGSSEEYGGFAASRSDQYCRLQNGDIVLDERAPLNPQSPYAVSKAAADFLARNFYDAYDMPVVVTRMFNNFGPRQNPHFITGRIITQALDHPQVEMGRPEARRDFTYVSDGVRGHLLAAIAGHPGDTYVFGQGNNLSIREWVQLILQTGERHRYWAKRELLVRRESYRPGRTDEADLLAEPSRLQQLTGWQPQVGWEDGVERTIQWYAKNRSCWESQLKWYPT